MPQKNYYEILGVSYAATQDEIKKAFRTLAKQYHPDINPDPNATEIMQKIAEAYEILSDVNSRKEYDIKLNINKFYNTTSSSTSATYRTSNPYSSYTRQREESEIDFEEWLKEYLKAERARVNAKEQSYLEEVIKILIKKW